MGDKKCLYFRLYIPIALQVYNQINSSGGDRASIILVITDGEFDDPLRAIQQVD